MTVTLIAMVTMNEDNPMALAIQDSHDLLWFKRPARAVDE